MIELWDAVVIAGVTLLVVVVLHLGMFGVARILKPAPPVVQYVPQPVYSPPPAPVAPAAPTQSFAAPTAPTAPPPSFAAPQQAPTGPLKYDPQIYKEPSTTVQVPTYAPPPPTVQNQPPFDPPRQSPI